jgi:hypothetical protein
MAEHDLPPPTHTHEDDIPRGGPWVRYIAISFALVLAMLFVPQSWKMPLAILSIVSMVAGIGMLMVKRR